VKKICLLGFILILSNQVLKSQERSLYYKIETLPGYITPNHVPFWLRSNQFGSIPVSDASLSIIGSICKEYNTRNPKFFDWGVSVEGRANIGNKSNFTLIEGYGKVRLGAFEIRAGRTKEITGLCDTTLSCGAFAVSGNSLGIPKIQIGIPDFYSLPVFDKLFAFKGTYVHGWIGEISERTLNNSILPLKTFLHQTTLYGRFGKPDWKIKLYGGFNHQAYWGSEASYYGSAYTLSDLECYFYVITGKAYGTSTIPSSKIGNHVGSIDVGFEYNLNHTRIFAYHQFFYDVGALYYLANVRDGLNGFSLTNTQYRPGPGFHWKKILLEFLFTKNQAGEFWSPFTPSGDENYYNNDQYIEGYSYKGNGVGNPFICSRSVTREGLPADPGDYFINNRVVAFHVGFEGSVQKWNFLVKTSYSLNYGTFGTSEVGHTFGKIRTLPVYGIFKETKQLSAYFEANKEFIKHLISGVIVAFDSGELYYNSLAVQLRFSKSF